MAATSVAEPPPPRHPSDMIRILMSQYQKSTIAMQAIVDKLSKADSSKLLCSEEEVIMSLFLISQDERGDINTEGRFAGYIHKETWLDAYNKEIELLKRHSPAYFKSINYPDSKDPILNEVLNNTLGRNVIAIPRIKHFLPLCPHNLVYIPLKLKHMAGIPMPRGVLHHVNGILISKKDGKFLRIEPSYYPGLKDTEEDEHIEEQIDSGVEDIVRAIGIEKPVQVRLDDKCPQKITGDTNCIFWSLFICQEIMRSERGLDSANEIIKFYSSKPLGELATIIQEFKAILIREIIPEYLKESGDSWPELEEFNREYPGYNGAARRRRKTRKRKTRRRKSKKAKKSKRPF